MYIDEKSAGARTARVFLALWPSDTVRDALVGRADGWRWPPGASRTKPERLHVTLHFIGSVPEDRLDELRSSLAVPCEPFDLVLDRETIWRGGIAVLEATQVPPPMAALHSRLADALRAMQLPVEERPFRPHVTFARKAFGAQPPASAPAIPWRADAGYRLVRTLGGGRGYEPLAGFA